MDHCENYYEENVFPQLEVLGYSDREMLSRLLSSVRMRNETWENLLDAAADSEHAFRKKLTHYERQNVEALGKLRVLEPQLALNESEYQKLAKEVSKVERKNRALIETQRHYERKRMQLDADLEEKAAFLKQTDAQKRRAEIESKRNIEDHQRKVRAETERQIAETQTSAARKISQKDEKLSKLRRILNKNGSLSTAANITPDTSARSTRRHRSNSESAEPVVQSTPTRRMSQSSPKKSSPKKQAPKKLVYHGSLESIVNPRAITNQRFSNSSLRSSVKNQRLDYEINPRNESTEMLQVRRPSSADGRRWLAHTPKDTMYTNTVLQNSVMLQPEHIRKSSSLITKFKAKLSLIKPSISSNKRVHVPSELDLKKSDRYLLTHQEQGDCNELRTTIVKGEIVDTKMGGIQVKFTGKERLTQTGLQDKRPAEEDECEVSHSSDNSTFTDIATRCNMAVVHKKGAETAEITNVSSRHRLVRDLNASSTSIRIVDNRDGFDSTFRSDFL